LSLDCHFYSNKYTKNGVVFTFEDDLGKRGLAKVVPTG